MERWIIFALHHFMAKVCWFISLWPNNSIGNDPLLPYMSWRKGFRRVRSGSNRGSSSLSTTPTLIVDAPLSRTMVTMLMKVWRKCWPLCLTVRTFLDQRPLTRLSSFKLRSATIPLSNKIDSLLLSVGSKMNLKPRILIWKLRLALGRYICTGLVSLVPSWQQCV